MKREEKCLCFVLRYYKFKGFDTNKAIECLQKRQAHCLDTRLEKRLDELLAHKLLGNNPEALIHAKQISIWKNTWRNSQAWNRVWNNAL